MSITEPTANTGPTASDIRDYDHETDLLVFGSGAGGLAASLFGTMEGLRVVLCEKTDMIGGTTATSGGIVWIPLSRQARAAGIDDNADKVRLYLKLELGDYYRSDLIEAFLAAGPKALATLEENTEVKFDVVNWPDYHANQQGAMTRGRSLQSRNFDGRTLGDDFRLVRAPIHRLMLLGGMSVGADEIPHFLRPFSSWRSFSHVVKKLLRYAGDRLRHSRGTDIRNGNALVARAYYSLRKTPAEVWLDSPLVELIREGGRVTGAVVTRDGRTVRVRAHRGVVLATGGFPHSPEMRAKYASHHPHTQTLAFEGNVGDGIKAALSVGASVDTALASPGLWTPASVYTDRRGVEQTVIYGYLDRGRPGVIAVDPEGRRFVNESNSYHDIVMAMFGEAKKRSDSRESLFHFVCDSDFVRRHGLGLIRPFPINIGLRKWADRKYIHMGDTIEELAAKIGVSAKVLADTVARHNGFCETGVDTDFGKGSSAYNTSFGDPTLKNPNLAPIVRPPFIALRIHAATLGTTFGLKTNGDACVVTSDDQPIPGLYACGNELASAMRGLYPGGGVTLGPAIAFAYRAVRHCVGKSI